MLQAAVQNIESLVEDVRLHIVTTNPKRLKRFCPSAIPIDAHRLAHWQAAKIAPIPQRITPAFILNTIRSLEDAYKFNHPKRALHYARLNRGWAHEPTPDFEDIFSLVSSADAVIATGGGYLNDVFKQQATGILHTLRIAQQLGKPTALFGQGIGPFTNKKLFRRVKRILASANLVSLREPIQAKAFYEKAGLKYNPAQVTGDDALSLISDTQPQLTNTCFGINIRDAGYANYSNKTNLQLKPILQQIYTDFDYPWLPVPVDISESKNDEQAARELINPGNIAKDYNTPQSPQELIELITHCKLVITGSYHAAVFALSQGVPVCALAKSPYYFGKFAGLQVLFKSGINTVDLSSPKLGARFHKAIEGLVNFTPSDAEQLRIRARHMATRSKKCYADFLHSI